MKQTPGKHQYLIAEVPVSTRIPKLLFVRKSPSKHQAKRGCPSSGRSPYKVVADSTPSCGPIPTPKEASTLVWSRLADDRLATQHPTVTVCMLLLPSGVHERMNLDRRAKHFFRLSTSVFRSIQQEITGCLVFHGNIHRLRL